MKFPRFRSAKSGVAKPASTSVPDNLSTPFLPVRIVNDDVHRGAPGRVSSMAYQPESPEFKTVSSDLKQGKFARLSINTMALPRLGSNDTAQYARIKSQRQVLQELIQATEFQDLQTLANRHNAVSNIGNTITLAGQQCPRLQPRFSMHLTEKMRHLLIANRLESVFESTADEECKRYFNSQRFSENLVQFCETKEGFFKAARFIFKMIDRQTLHQTVFRDLQAQQDACAGEKAKFFFLKDTWEHALVAPYDVSKDAVFEYICFSVGKLSQTIAQKKFILDIQEHLPVVTKNFKKIIDCHLVPFLMPVTSGSRVSEAIPE